MVMHFLELAGYARCTDMSLAYRRETGKALAGFRNSRSWSFARRSGLSNVVDCLLRPFLKKAIFQNKKKGISKCLFEICH